VPQTASQLFAKNMTNFVLHLVKDGKLVIDAADEITSQTLITQKGEIVNARVREQHKLALLQPLAAAV
jgi:NAD(P) transhydrogenase subunit alpha